MRERSRYNLSAYDLPEDMWATKAKKDNVYKVRCIN